MGRHSTVGTHPQIARIDSMLDDGVPYSTISTQFGLSVSSVGRYALSRKSELARITNGEPNAPELSVRLMDVADHAREARVKAKAAGTPVAQMRAIRAEVEVIGKLADQLGISDARQAQAEGDVLALVQGIAKFATDDPQSARSLLRTLEAFPRLKELSTAISQKVENPS